MREICNEIIIENNLSVEVKKTAFYSILAFSSLLGGWGLTCLVSGFLQSDSILSFVRSFFNIG